jgi:two-component system chemotaxis response regulator CheB
VVICSAAPSDGQMVLKALALGAVDVVPKPTLEMGGFEESAILLADSLRAAAAAKGRVGPAPLPHAVIAPPAARTEGTPSHIAIAIGASTGGTEALLKVLRELPPTAPGILVVQHMPAPFTAPFAARLNEACRITVREARDGDQLEQGVALIAPGDRHMRLCRQRRGLGVEIFDGPLVSRHRPSVDVLFHSVATAAGQNAVGAILTGMGDDGADGMRAMRAAGAVTFAQDEASCVVNGMPARARERGGVMSVVLLSEMARHLIEASESMGAR